MCRRDLGSQQRQLCIIERCAGHRPEIGLEVCRCDGRDEGSYVGEGAVEGGDRGVVEIVAGCDGLDLVEGGVAGANHGYSAEGELVGGVDGGEPAAGLSGFYQQRRPSGIGERRETGALQWLESLDNVWPSCVPRSLDIDKEV